MVGFPNRRERLLEVYRRTTVRCAWSARLATYGRCQSLGGAAAGQVDHLKSPELPYGASFCLCDLRRHGIHAYGLSLCLLSRRRRGMEGSAVLRMGHGGGLRGGGSRGFNSRWPRFFLLRNHWEISPHAYTSPSRPRQAPLGNHCYSRIVRINLQEIQHCCASWLRWIPLGEILQHLSRAVTMSLASHVTGSRARSSLCIVVSSFIQKSQYLETGCFGGHARSSSYRLRRHAYLFPSHNGQTDGTRDYFKVASGEAHRLRPPTVFYSMS